MYWEEGDNELRQQRENDVVDVSYRIKCSALPVDHAHALATAVVDELPWLMEETRAGVHSIHVADSGNGWMRPQDPQDLIFPSRRTRMILRLPVTRIDSALGLVGKTLDIAGNPLEIGEAAVKGLQAIGTLFARYLVTADNDDEEAFLAEIARQLNEIGIRPRKMICGISKTISTSDDIIRTRSLMLADLSPEDSLTLQQEGMGEHRHLGCGIFIPHKDVNKLHELEKDAGN